MLLFLLWTFVGIAGLLIVWAKVLDNPYMDFTDAVFIMFLGTIFGPITLIFLFAYLMLRWYSRTLNKEPQ